MDKILIKEVFLYVFHEHELPQDKKYESIIMEMMAKKVLRETEVTRSSEKKSVMSLGYAVSKEKLLEVYGIEYPKDF